MRTLQRSVSGIENVKCRRRVSDAVTDDYVLNSDPVVVIDRDVSLVG